MILKAQPMNTSAVSPSWSAMLGPIVSFTVNLINIQDARCGTQACVSFPWQVHSIPAVMQSQNLISVLPPEVTCWGSFSPSVQPLITCTLQGTVPYPVTHLAPEELWLTHSRARPWHISLWHITETALNHLHLQWRQSRILSLCSTSDRQQPTQSLNSAKEENVFTPAQWNDLHTHTHIHERYTCSHTHKYTHIYIFYIYI